MTEICDPCVNIFCGMGSKIKNGHTDQNYFRFSVGYRF